MTEEKELQAEQRFVAIMADNFKIDLRSAEQAIKYADKQERRGCAFWNGLVQGYAAAIKLQNS